MIIKSILLILILIAPFKDRYNGNNILRAGGSINDPVSRTTGTSRYKSAPSSWNWGHNIEMRRVDLPTVYGNRMINDIAIEFYEEPTVTKTWKRLLFKILEIIFGISFSGN